MIPAIGVRSSNYISYFQSDYHPWFAEMGYPELDIVSYPDGEWAVVEYLKKPVIPSLTPWNFALSGLRNQEKSYDFLKAWADQHDLAKRHVWVEQDKLEKRLQEQQLAEDRRSQDFVTRAHAAIVRNDGLMQRIAENGPGELHPFKLLKHCPKSNLGY